MKILTSGFCNFNKKIIHFEILKRIINLRINFIKIYFLNIIND